MSRRLKRRIRKKEVGWMGRHLVLFIAGIFISLGLMRVIEDQVNGQSPLIIIGIGILMFLAILYFYDRKLYYFR